MDQVIDFFKGLFSTDLWPARWHCGKWSDFHGWFYIISDLMIWSSYFAMPVIIVSYIRKQKNIRFLPIYYLFAAFILACGTTHLIDAITFWIPLYRLNALIRFITGCISWITVFYLVKVLPIAFSLKPPELLEAEIEQRKVAEEELKLKIRQLNEAQEIARMGHWEWDVKSNHITWSDGLFKVFGVPPAQESLSFEKYLAHIHPEDRAYTSEMINNAATTKQFTEFYHRVVTADGTTKTIHSRGEIITDANGELLKMIGTAQDVTDQKKTEQALVIKSNELLASNDELQKFAYIASHDLQEPLRKIKTFSSMLKTDYKEQLEDRGKGYLEKIISATIRMQRLINDILSFSQLTTVSLQFENTALSNVLKDVLSDIEVAVEQSGAIITCGALPAVEANASQVGQLLQNLLSNAIKFRQEDTRPEISISAEVITTEQSPYLKTVHPHYKFSGWGANRFWQNEQFCKITVSDKGIGFDKAYADRVFMLFQRLDTQSTYEGTGIGLAICKKIVENHRGIIYVDSEVNKGSIFTILLPVSQLNFESVGLDKEAVID